MTKANLTHSPLPDDDDEKETVTNMLNERNNGEMVIDENGTGLAAFAQGPGSTYPADDEDDEDDMDNEPSFNNDDGDDEDDEDDVRDPLAYALEKFASEYIHLRQLGMFVARETHSSIRFFELRDVQLTLQTELLLPNDGLVTDLAGFGAAVTCSFTGTVHALIRGISEDDETGQAVTVLPVANWEYGVQVSLENALLESPYITHQVGDKFADIEGMLKRYVKRCRRNSALASNPIMQRLSDVSASLAEVEQDDDATVGIEGTDDTLGYSAQDAERQSNVLKKINKIFSKPLVLTGEKVANLTEAMLELDKETGSALPIGQIIDEMQHNLRQFVATCV